MIAAPERPRWYRLTPERVVVALLAVEGLLWLSERFRWFSFNQHKGWTVLVCLATVVAAFVLMFLWFLAALLFRLRFQFSIRSLLVLMVVVATACGWLTAAMNRARKQQVAVEAIEKAGGDVGYDWEIGAFHLGSGPEPPGPAWLRRMLGHHFLASVAAAEVHDVTDELLEPLSVLTQLQNRDVWRPNVGDAGVQQLKDSLQLQVFCLVDYNATDGGLERLKGLSQLQSLAFSGIKVSDAGLRHLEGMTQLHSLVLHGMKISDAGLQHLKGLTQLQLLDLEGTELSDAGLQHLEGMTQLQWLCLNGTRVSDAGLEHLKGLTHLKVLALGGTNISNAGLECLKGLPRLGDLNLQSTKVSDAGLENLKGLPQLQSLWLWDTMVSDAGLEHLKGLTQLRWLGLSGTGISDKGVKKLQQALPNCDIQHGYSRSNP